MTTQTTDSSSGWGPLDLPVGTTAGAKERKKHPCFQGEHHDTTSNDLKVLLHNRQALSWCAPKGFNILA